MSNDMRDLLRGAAASPSRPADVDAARRQGRRMRVQRRAISGFAIVAVVALGSVAIANLVPSDHASAPVATKPPTPAAVCAPLSSAPDIPEWALAARPPSGVPHVLSPDGNVLAVVFGAPLSSPPDPMRGNKILWIVREPRAGKPLEITATLRRSRTVSRSFPANSGPGEIYPSGVDVPAPGCWHFALSWNGHHAAINLRYETPPPPPTTSSTTTSTTVPHTSPAPTSCHTPDLTITLGPQIGSAGHFNYEIAFRNTGTVGCTMTGFPGVSFLDVDLHQIGVPAQRNTLTYATVTVQPGATAYAHVAVVDTSVQNCPGATPQAIRVYPPNETASADIVVRGLRVCSDQTPGATIDPVLDHSLT